MKSYLALIVGAYLALTSSPSNKLDLSDTEWISYKSQYNKSYESDEVELMRRSIFAHNKQRIETFNSKNGQGSKFSLGINHLTDMSNFEIKTLMNGYKRSGNAAQNTPEAEKFLKDVLNDKSIEVPDEVDWRKVDGRVSSVKNQGFCGSCWAFSTVNALEGQEKLRMKNGGGSNFSIVDLSPQNLMDCSKENGGCEGGNMAPAFDFIRTEGGIDDLASYPYLGKDAKCHFNKDKVAISDSDFVQLLAEGNEEKLEEVVAKFGPVSVAIDASSDSFSNYNSGVYHDKECDEANLDHAVLVVGYGKDPVGGNYWLVKNSWGDQWGEKGYIRMARNKDNMCGIATAAIIPTF